MLNKFLLVAAIILAGFSACKKDNSGIQLKPHDQDRMMDSMHAMMNRMDSMPKTNDPEIDFVKMMIMHHQGAINMANVELQAGTNDSLKQTAQKIITEQQKETTLKPDRSDTAFTTEQMNNMTKMGKMADEQLITGDIDNDFATLMIIHHRSAIDNSSSYLHHGDDEQIKTMAHKIVNSQTMGIVGLSQWLAVNKR